MMVSCGGNRESIEVESIEMPMILNYGDILGELDSDMILEVDLKTHRYGRKASVWKISYVGA